MTDANGAASQTTPCTLSPAAPAALRDLLLADLELDQESKGRLIRSHVAPAIARLQKAAAAPAAIDDVMQLGAAVGDSDVSVIVPLYKRIDLVEYQLAQFALDPAMRRTELTYVLDSPELAPAMRDAARQLHELYRVPFRVVFLKRNLGFAGANNAAVPTTSGRLLLLLNSDVMPSRAGWVDRMRAFYDGTPGIGALGAKLLYEDETLQHAGLYFRREPHTAVWQNEHYFKGLEQTFAPANVTRKVPAVTGACLMISRALYLEQGGLRGMYLQGDYEDSDLCLRLLTAGYDNWYLPEVALYHLEGQSYGWTGRTRASRYNAWTHTHMWDDVIRTTMAKFTA